MNHATPPRPASNVAPSLEDLARHLNLAVATVSRALNGNARVNPKTRTRVANAAAEIGYRPSPLARGLRLGKTGLVGICFYMNSPARNVLISQQLYFLQKFLAQAGKQTLVEFSAWDYPEKRRTIEHFLSMNVDGIIHTGSLSPDLLKYLEHWRTKGVPYVLLNPSEPDLPFSVTLNRQAVYTRMTDYLLDLGHRKLVTLGMVQDQLGYEARFRGMRESFAKRGLSFEENVEVCFEIPYPLETSGAYGYRLAERFYPVIKEATACLTSNDDVGIGAIRYLREKGVQVPDDLSLIGFDDASTAAFSSPSITTATQEIEATAMRTLSVLNSAWNDGADLIVPPVKIDSVFLIRESSAPPKMR